MTYTVNTLTHIHTLILAHPLLGRIISSNNDNILLTIKNYKKTTQPKNLKLTIFYQSIMKILDLFFWVVKGKT